MTPAQLTKKREERDRLDAEIRAAEDASQDEERSVAQKEHEERMRDTVSALEELRRVLLADPPVAIALNHAFNQIAGAARKVNGLLPPYLKTPARPYDQMLSGFHCSVMLMHEIRRVMGRELPSGRLDPEYWQDRRVGSEPLPLVQNVNMLIDGAIELCKHPPAREEQVAHVSGDRPLTPSELQQKAAEATAERARAIADQINQRERGPVSNTARGVLVDLRSTR